MARFQQRVTSFDLEQLRRAYERHLNLFMVQAFNRRESRSAYVPNGSATEPYDNNPVIVEWTQPPSGGNGDVSGLTSSGGS